MIRLKNVSKMYGPDIVGVKNVNLHIRPGEFVSIVGQSGTGKSTLVKLLIAEEKPSGGSIQVGGWEIGRIQEKDVPGLRRQIGVVFQDFKLLPKKTVFENVSFALEVAGVSGRRIREVVPHVLRIVNLAGKEDRYPQQLSGGEQQRVVIARSLVHRPKLIVADEPTGNLDSIHTGEIVDIFRKINEFGTTVVMVTHNREIVNAMRKRVLTIHAGEIVADHEEGKYLI
ncbi:MAG: cell division ATP-binding protein FtsE [Patescibacteria group bacterium]|jgi:cell division transport system ATP-binding protein